MSSSLKMVNSRDCEKIVLFFKYLYQISGETMPASGTFIFRDPESHIFNTLISCCPDSVCPQRPRVSVTHKKIKTKPIANLYYPLTQKKWLVKAKKNTVSIDVVDWNHIQQSLNQFEVNFEKIVPFECYTPYQLKLVDKEFALIYQFRIDWSKTQRISADNRDLYTFLKLERNSSTLSSSSLLTHTTSMASHYLSTKKEAHRRENCLFQSERQKHKKCKLYLPQKVTYGDINNFFKERGVTLSTEKPEYPDQCVTLQDKYKTIYALTHAEKRKKSRYPYNNKNRVSFLKYRYKYQEYFGSPDNILGLKEDRLLAREKESIRDDFKLYNDLLRTGDELFIPTLVTEKIYQKFLDLKEKMELSQIDNLKDGILVIMDRKKKDIEKLDYEFAIILERSAFPMIQSFRKQTQKQQGKLMEEIKILQDWLRRIDNPNYKSLRQGVKFLKVKTEVYNYIKSKDTVSLIHNTPFLLTPTPKPVSSPSSSPSPSPIPPIISSSPPPNLPQILPGTPPHIPSVTPPETRPSSPSKSKKSKSKSKSSNLDSTKPLMAVSDPSTTSPKSKRGKSTQKKKIKSKAKN